METKEKIWKLYQRNRDLQKELAQMQQYKNISIDIYNAAVGCADGNDYLKTSWILGKFRWFLK